MDTPNLTSLREDAQKMLTCAPVAPCPRESHCFRVAQTLLKWLPEPIVEAPDEDPDEVLHYAPQWEAPRGPLLTGNHS